MKKPMLAYAKTPPLTELKYPLLASPKLDGIRCVVSGGVPYSRNLKIIPNKYVQAVVKDLNLHGLDGELMVEGDFNSVQSAIMSEQGTPNFYYYVFDLWDAAAGFGTRLSLARDFVQHCNSPFVRLVEHTLVETPEELAELWALYEAQGYEGAIVRSIHGRYKEGRSTLKEGYMVKLKTFHDAEALVVGYEELLHNENEPTTDALGRQVRSKHNAGMASSGMLGALIVVYQGVQFKIGTGFDADQRKQLWDTRQSLLNRLVTFKYQELSAYNVPRFPVFKGFRYE